MADNAPKSYRVGPGSLLLGEDTDEMEISQQVKALTVTWDKDKEDDDHVLSGDTISGEATYTAQVSGTVNQDLVADGFLAMTWNEKGKVKPFKYIPNSDREATVTGKLVLDPLDIGGDVKSRAESEFEFDCEGEPKLDFASTGDDEAKSTYSDEY